VENSIGKALTALNGPILITGHTGFKGTWLTLLLEQMGLEVAGISLPAQENSLFKRMNRKGKISESFTDIRNFEQTQKKIAEYAPSVVFHMAAQPLVLNSYKSPRETFDTNVMGTANVLDSCFHTDSVKAVIAITTDKVYKNTNRNKRFVENDSLAGKDPYSASKVGSEAVIAAWQQIALVNGGPRVISVRAGNVIGGGDFAEDRLLPDLIRGFSANIPVSVRNPNSTRPWQHVLDPLNGYMSALAHTLEGGREAAFNFGPTEESLAVGEVVKIAAEIWGERAKTVLNREVIENKESLTLQLDSTLANSVLGWKPSWNQKDAIISTVQWWKKILLKKEDPLSACQADIEKLLKNK
jgi:CDP-glucose 4,6-dehydratase